MILLFVLTLATVCYYRHLVRVAEAAELEKSEAPKREAAAAVQEVAVPLDDMDFSARTHDLYASAECAVCLAGFSADDGPVILPCARPCGIPTRLRHRAELGPSDVISAQARTPSTTPASRRGGRRVWKATRRSRAPSAGSPSATSPGRRRGTTSSRRAARAPIRPRRPWARRHRSARPRQHRARGRRQRCARLPRSSSGPERPREPAPGAAGRSARGRRLHALLRSHFLNLLCRYLPATDPSCLCLRLIIATPVVE